MTIPATSFMIVPVAITDSMLASCTVLEPADGETLWNAGTSYAVGAEAIRTSVHKKYRRVIAGTTSTPPEDDSGDGGNWLEIGSTNRWAQFDRKIGTKTTKSGSITTVLENLGSFEGLALLDIAGSSVDVVQSIGATVLKTVHVDLDVSVVNSVYDWMYGDYVQRVNLVISDLLGQFPSSTLSITINGTSTVAVGVTAVGKVQTLGATEYGAGAGITNYGKVTDDGFGNRDWLEGDWANRTTLPIIANRADLPGLHRRLARVRSTPCVYVGSDLAEYEPLVCYGVFKDLYITVPNYSLIQMNLEIDGMNNS